MTPDAPVQVLLMAEDPLVRAGLLTRLGRSEDLTVLGEASGPDEEVPEAVDVILWDLGMHVMPGLPVLASAPLPEWPPLLVLVPGERAAEEARGRGVEGVLSRSGNGASLAAAVRAVAAGLYVSDRSFGAGAGGGRGEEPGAGRSREQNPAGLESPLREPLTAREHEVLLLLTEGMSNREIAEKLRMSEHTVKFHLNAIMQKLGVARRTEAVVRAARLGLVVL